MKRNSRNLPINLQMQKISGLLTKKGISPDTIDLYSRLDRTLKYRENVRGINNFLGRSLYPREIKGRTSSYELTEKAQEIHDKRSNTAKRVDWRLRAKRTYYPDSITKKQFLNWRNNPNQYDIESVDTRGGY